LESIGSDRYSEDKGLERTWSRVDETADRLGCAVTSPEKVSNQLRGTRNMIKSIDSSLPKLEKELGLRRGTIKKLLNKLLLITETILPLVSRRKKATENRQKPAYEASLNSDRLANVLMKKRDSILQKLRSFHRIPPTPAELKRFLRGYRRIVNCARELLRYPLILRGVSIMPVKDTAFDGSQYSLKMSIHNIFDTNENILVLGEAGSGKTTSLQMYVKRRAGTGQRKYIFMPLSFISSNIG